MSLSEALGPYSVIHHFYPINPDTATQQQSAVYNEPDHPIVAPIARVPSPQPRQSPKKKKSRQREDESDLEFEALLADSQPMQRSKRARTATQPSVRSQNQELDFSPIRPQKRQRIYVEIPVPKSFDLTSYTPISLGPAITNTPLGRGKRHKRARAVSSPTPVTEFSNSPSPTPALSHASDGSYEPDSESFILPINSEETQGPPRGVTKSRVQTQATVAVVADVEDEATTCHQCRRKTTREKMRCRNLRPDGNVCTFYFCQGCVEIRYDEFFDSFHTTWHCPRCRGICNCSICLRKAGFGYILDGPASSQLTGRHGRLSVGRRKDKATRGKVKVSGGDSGEQVSVRAWLARQGIALGTETWMEERRRQGIRFVVGKSPPPSDRPSPYKEADLNPTLRACEEYMDNDDDDDDVDANDVGFPLHPMLKGEGGGALAAASESSTIQGGGPSSSPQMKGVDLERFSPATNGVPNHGSGIYGSLTFKSEVQPLSFPPPSQTPFSQTRLPLTPRKPTEDVPGLDSAAAPHVRLIVGSPFTRSSPRKRPGPLKLTKPKVVKRRKRADTVDSDDDYASYTELKIQLPAIRVGGPRPPSLGPQWIDEKEPIIGPSSPEHMSPLSSFQHAGPSSRPEHDVTFFYADNAPATPPPPPAAPEPVFVPTEHYMPSKLDATRVKDPQTQFGHSYWSLNAFNSHDQDCEQDRDHGHVPETSPSLFTGTTLYSYNEPYYEPHLALNGLSPDGPSHTASGSGSTTLADSQHSRSASTLHTPDDYLTRHAHENGYAVSELSSFASLEDTWLPVSEPSLPSLGMDVPPLQMESVTHAVHAALRSVGIQGTD